MVGREEIRDAIIQTLEEYQEEGVQTPDQINRGACEEFAEQVNQKLDEEMDVLTTADITGDDPDEKPEPWHVWITDGERHYDVEHPSGVESWAKLDFWTRTVTKQPNIAEA